MSRQTNERLFCWQFDRIARLLLSIIGRLHQRRLAQWNIEFVKVDSKVFHIRNKLSKHCPNFFEILPKWQKFVKSGTTVCR